MSKEFIPFALSALAGFKVCLIAYGQTGSGKTKTMKDVTDLLVGRIFKEKDGRVEVKVSGGERKERYIALYMATSNSPF